MRKRYVACALAYALLGCSGQTAEKDRAASSNVGAAAAQADAGAGGMKGSSPSLGQSSPNSPSASATGGTDGSKMITNSCASAMIEPVVNRSPGNVLVIYDRSLSMDMAFENGASRFDATDAALRAGLMPFVCPPATVDGDSCMETLTVGAILFPSTAPPLLIPDCTQIVDPIDASTQIYWKPVSEFLSAWDAFWSNPTTGQLVLGTPIEDAFNKGAAAIDSSGLPGTFVVIFLTDGESTCLALDVNYPAVDAVGQATAWAAQGIKTYVVSVAPPTGTFNDQVAQAGGTSPALNPSDTSQLTMAIQSIVAETVEVTDCKTTLSGQKLSDLKGACERGLVTLGTAEIACDPVDGFQITSDSELELYGAACEGLKSGLTLKAEFPCDVLLL